MVTGSGTGWKAYNHQKQEWCAFYGGPETNAPYIDCYMADNYFWGNRRHLMKAVPTSMNGDYGFKWGEGEICWTHPEVIDILTERVKQWVLNEPRMRIFSITQNDYANYCEY